MSPNTTPSAPRLIAASAGRRRSDRERLTFGAGRLLAWPAKTVIASGSDDHDFARRMIEQPGDVFGPQTLAPCAGRGDHDAVEALMGDRLAHRMAQRAAAIDPRVDGHPERRGALLDRLQQRQS